MQVVVDGQSPRPDIWAYQHEERGSGSYYANNQLGETDGITNHRACLVTLMMRKNLHDPAKSAVSLCLWLSCLAVCVCPSEWMRMCVLISVWMCHRAECVFIYVLLCVSCCFFLCLDCLCRCVYLTPNVCVEVHVCCVGVGLYAT